MAAKKASTVIRFFGPLEVSVDPNGVTRTLTHELRLADDFGDVWYIPAGFKTDFASTPRLMWRICPPAHGLYVWAAVVHDAFYRVPTYNLTRKRADKIFLGVMKFSGVPLWKRHMMYRAVRMFGGGSWKAR